MENANIQMRLFGWFSNTVSVSFFLQWCVHFRLISVHRYIPFCYKCSSLRSLILFNPLCILSLIHWIHYWLCIEYICRTKTRPANLYPLPNIGAGKRVPFQSLPHSKETDRNCSCAVPHWTSDQNLVPKPSHEVEERK